MTLENATPLSTQIRAFVGTHDNPRFQHLLVLARQFGEAARNYQNALDADSADRHAATKRMIGCWARARKAYCELSGRDLL